MKKVYIVFCLVVSMLMIVSACSKESGGDSKKKDLKDEKIELLYMTHTSDTEEQKRVLEEDIIGAFEKEHPNIKIKLIQNEDPDTLVRQQMAAGAGPDIVLVDGPTTLLQFAKSGYLLPLDEYADEFGWNQRYFEWAYDTGYTDDKLYGLPGQYESLVVWYNKDMFKENGWQEPNNFQDFIALNEKIKKSGKIPVAFGTTDFRPSNEWWLSVVYNSYLGGTEFKKVLKNELSWSSDLMQEATQTWKELWQEGYINEKQSHAISIEDSWYLFNNEEAAMKMEGTWATSRLTTDPPSFEVDFFVMPAWRDGLEPTLPMALGESAGINSKTKHPKESAQFLDWLFSDEVGTLMAEQGLFYPNENIDVTSINNIDPIILKVYEALEESFEKGNTGYASWTYWGPNVEQYLWDNIDGVFLEQFTVEEYLRNADEKAKKDEDEGLLFDFKE
ncbi:ABC transporter substrate-binding protein [Bacillus sp. FJAT-50079]|uniref:ABC transporter substrate-binding protein n=1 Tax=Bacillus sp. FJAT-50079 TaxID=2833577 RepID=UPI001BC91CBC|nr:ABC transporter substrate-binding protein [Bacillus sp. FJAT-50079]MBS4210500.1 carbohydrate ABC transporter substrate-binding protein [Bacillus sp. FJAT-50079]